MEVDRVATHLAELTHVLELNVRDATDVGIVARGMDQDVSTILVEGRLFITLEYNITLHESDLCTDLDTIRAVTLQRGIVFVGKRCRQNQGSLATKLRHRIDDCIFSLFTLKTGRCDHDLFTSLPVDFSHEGE